MPLPHTLSESSVIDPIRLAASPQARCTQMPVEPAAARDVYPWRVVHACEQARDVLPVVESQLTVGMRPFIVTARGSGAACKYYRSPKEKIETASLLQAWSDVRTWKRLLIDSDPERTAEVLHAHSFAAGMAGVRADASLVYDVHPSSGSVATEDKSWLGRSFRVAEHFVLTSAGAVVVHSEHAWQECTQAGVEETNLFYIPNPVDAGWLESIPDRRWLEQRIGADGGTTIFFVPGFSSGRALEPQISALLRAFAFAHAENENVRLLFLHDKDTAAVRQHAEVQKVRHVIHVLRQAERDLIFASCDVVVVLESSDDDGQALKSIEALARGRALLVSADENRSRSIPAKSCLWFRPEEPREFGYRMAFLARNPDICRIISSNGQRTIAGTRSPEVVGRLYDQVYTRVASRKKQKDNKSNDVQLVPLQVNL